MKKYFTFAFMGAALLGVSLQSSAGPISESDLAWSEAGFRTIALQCATPKFSAAYVKQSKAFMRSVAFDYQTTPDALERDVARQVNAQFIRKEDCHHFMEGVNEMYQAHQAMLERAAKKPASSSS